MPIISVHCFNAFFSLLFIIFIPLVMTRRIFRIWTRIHRSFSSFVKQASWSKMWIVMKTFAALVQGCVWSFRSVGLFFLLKLVCNMRLFIRSKGLVSLDIQLFNFLVAFFRFWQFLFIFRVVYACNHSPLVSRALLYT